MKLEQIVLKAQQGDGAAIEEIFLRFRGFIIKTSQRFYIKGYDMDDLIQIGNISLFKAIQHYKSEKTDCCNKDNYLRFVGYACRAIKNQYYTEISKKAKCNAEVSLDERLEGGDRFTDLLPAEDLVEDNLIKREERKQIASVLEKLSTEEAEMIRCLFFRGMTIKQYADRTGIKYITCVKRKESILKKLRNEYTKII